MTRDTVRGTQARSPSRGVVGLVPRSAIRRFARQITERFRPNKIILFGSYAYGEPDPDSDVDILVVMRAANAITQAVRIRQQTDHPFPLDLIVRTPEEVRRGLGEGDWLLSEALGKGTILHEKGNGGVGSQSRTRPGRHKKTRAAVGLRSTTWSVSFASNARKST